MRRRTLLKSSLATGVAGLAAGLLTPGQLRAAYPKAAFDSAEVVSGLSSAFAISDVTQSSDITIKAPSIAKNGAIVPIQISTEIEAVESISIIVEQNTNPFVASFNVPGSVAFVSTRIKMKKTSNVIAVVKAGEMLFSARMEIKVTKSGCDG